MSKVKIQVEVDLQSENQSKAMYALFDAIRNSSTPIVVSSTADLKVEVHEYPTTEEKPAAKPAKKAPKPTPAPVEEETEEVEEKPEITEVQIRALVKEKAVKYREEVKAALTKLGADNVSSLKPEKYEKFYKYLTSLGKAGDDLPF